MAENSNISWTDHRRCAVDDIAAVALRLHYWLRRRSIPMDGLVLELKAPSEEVAYRLRMGMARDLEGALAAPRSRVEGTYATATVAGIQLEITGPRDRGEGR